MGWTLSTYEEFLGRDNGNEKKFAVGEESSEHMRDTPVL